MNSVRQPYQQLAAKPSDLPTYARICELVRKGCLDTSDKSAWSAPHNQMALRNKDCSYPSHLQERLLAAAAAVLHSALHCGAVPSIGLHGGGPDFPPVSGSGDVIPELGQASKLLDEAHHGVHLPGDELLAVSYLLRAVAYLEMAVMAPAGVASRLGG